MSLRYRGGIGSSPYLFTGSGLPIPSCFWQ